MLPLLLLLLLLLRLLLLLLLLHSLKTPVSPNTLTPTAAVPVYSPCLHRPALKSIRLHVVVCVRIIYDQANGTHIIIDALSFRKQA